LGTFYNSSDGWTYIGEFQKGVKEGEGTILYRNKSYYSGQFKNDKRHGKGSYTVPDRESYIGTWRRDLVRIVSLLFLNLIWLPRSFSSLCLIFFPVSWSGQVDKEEWGRF